MAATTGIPVITNIAAISDKKLWFIANIFYYFVYCFLELYEFWRKFKSQILLLLIAIVIYKYFVWLPLIY